VKGICRRTEKFWRCGASVTDAQSDVGRANTGSLDPSDARLKNQPFALVGMSVRGTTRTKPQGSSMSPESDAHAADRLRRRTAEGERGGATQAQRGLGGALGVQHDRRRQAGSGGALSGLARAFFYAGARALLVSHWSVDSNAATRLTTTTFDYMKTDPTMGRAEALRRAMLDYMNDGSNPRNAYPAFWAPFEVVGDGAASSVNR
jgi:hypothetical protein